MLAAVGERDAQLSDLSNNRASRHCILIALHKFVVLAAVGERDAQLSELSNNRASRHCILIALHQFVVLATVGELMLSYKTSKKTEPQDIIYLDYHFRQAAIDSHLCKSRCSYCS